MMTMTAQDDESYYKLQETDTAALKPLIKYNEKGDFIFGEYIIDPFAIIYACAHNVYLPSEHGGADDTAVGRDAWIWNKRAPAH